MAVVQSDSGLVSVQRPWLAGRVYDSIALYNGEYLTYEQIYERQPELRTAVDFLARSIAQVPIHAFERVSDDERRRISTGPLAETLDRPDPMITRSRWLGALVRDLAIYDAAYLVKVRGEGGRVALVRLPPSTVELVGENWLRPESYKVHGTAGTTEFPAAAVIDIHGYNPSDPRKGLSVIETLRRVLAEQAAAGRYRENYWVNSARMSGIIERPQAAPTWSDAARHRFRAEFEAAYTGAAASGRTLVLEEGMQYRPVSFSARDSQYLESYQLSRELVCAAYGIPSGLLLGEGTYASLSEQHRQLYQDTLAPWLVWIQEELEAQLLPEFELPANTYLEAALQAKLAGSFQEQAVILSSSIGAPFLTRNEGRARLNLPPIDGGDDLITPMNVLVGDQASPQDSVSMDRQLAGLASAPAPDAKTAPIDGAKALRRRRVLETRERATKQLRAEMVDAFERQRRSVLSKLGAKKKSGIKASAADVFDRPRFRKELAADMKPVLKRTAKTLASTVGDWEPGDRVEEYLDEISDGFADAITDATFEELDLALDAEIPEEAVNGLFDGLVETTAALYAGSLVMGIGEFARSEAAVSNDLRTKTWLTTSGNPRSSHAELDGVTIPIDQTFPNGLRFPGDPDGDVSERANCACMLDWE